MKSLSSAPLQKKRIRKHSKALLRNLQEVEACIVHRMQHTKGMGSRTAISPQPPCSSICADGVKGRLEPRYEPHGGDRAGWQPAARAEQAGDIGLHTVDCGEGDCLPELGLREAFELQQHVCLWKDVRHQLCGYPAGGRPKAQHQHILHKGSNTLNRPLLLCQESQRATGEEGAWKRTSVAQPVLYLVIACQEVLHGVPHHHQHAARHAQQTAEVCP
mmetsp:Transcript_21185/g.58812  ORF Transcript_21185/g.58812 Transcript_21185/m.58812 type:complete len:217 (+) Transcript_21185:857-1507(+)